jgi:hypothetical protein
MARNFVVQFMKARPIDPFGLESFQQKVSETEQRLRKTMRSLYHEYSESN